MHRLLQTSTLRLLRNQNLILSLSKLNLMLMREESNRRKIVRSRPRALLIPPQDLSPRPLRVGTVSRLLTQLPCPLHLTSMIMAIHPQLLNNHILEWRLPLTPCIGELEVHIVALKDILVTIRGNTSQDLTIPCHNNQHFLPGTSPSGRLCHTKDTGLHHRWIDTGLMHNPSKVSSKNSLLVSILCQFS